MSKIPEPRMSVVLQKTRVKQAFEQNKADNSAEKCNLFLTMKTSYLPCKKDVESSAED